MLIVLQHDAESGMSVNVTKVKRNNEMVHG